MTSLRLHNFKPFLFHVFICIIFSMNVYSQEILDNFIEKQRVQEMHEDSIRNIYSGIYSDTVVNGVKLKMISEYPPYDHYYGKLIFNNGKISGNQQKIHLNENDLYPCYFFHYRSDGTLWDEGVFMGDCIYGPYIRYYTNSQISFTSNYISSSLGDQCSVIDGETVCYSRYGDKIISEFWNKGKLIRLSPYNNSFNGDVKFIVGDEFLSINDTLKITDLKQITLQADSEKNPELKSGFQLNVQVWQKKKHFLHYWYNDLKSFANSNFIDDLKKGNIKIDKPLQMSIEILWKQKNEFIEKHFLVFEK
jgi:hypothetical protein